MASYCGYAAPYIQLLNQPCSSCRMRYASEGKVNYLYAQSSSSQEEYDADSASQARSSRSTGEEVCMVQLCNAVGPARLTVCCVTANQPYNVHPNRLKSPSREDGVAIYEIPAGETVFKLSHLAIECSTKQNAKENLKFFKDMNLDPFLARYEKNPQEFDLGQVRLCFQVEILGNQYYKTSPIVSNVIKQRRKNDESIVIQKISQNTTPLQGGQPISLFFQKLLFKDKTLMLKLDDLAGWSQTLQITNIHYRCAMIFVTPPYGGNVINNPVTVVAKLYAPFTSEEDRQAYLNENGGENAIDGKYESSSFNIDYY